MTDLISLLAGGVCLLLHIVLTMGALRLPGKISPVVRHMAVAWGVHLAGITLCLVCTGELAYWPFAAIYWFGVICYLFAFSAVYKSVSLRILTALSHSSSHSATLADITTQYVLPEFEQRTRVMQSLGWVEKVDGRFTVTAKGQHTAEKLQRIQRIFGIQKSGLYG